MKRSVYVLTNPAMPIMEKIGKITRDLELRPADLYSTVITYFWDSMNSSDT